MADDLLDSLLPIMEGYSDESHRRDGGNDQKYIQNVACLGNIAHIHGSGVGLIILGLIVNNRRIHRNLRLFLGDGDRVLNGIGVTPGVLLGVRDDGRLHRSLIGGINRGGLGIGSVIPAAALHIDELDVQSNTPILILGELAQITELVTERLLFLLPQLLLTPRVLPTPVLRVLLLLQVLL